MNIDPGKTPEVSVDPADAQKNKVVSILAYIWILFFLPLVVCPQSPFGRFHANQGLVLFLVGTIGAVILKFIPVVGGTLAWIYGVLMLILTIVGIVNAATGKAKELPVIGSIHLLK